MKVAAKPIPRCPPQTVALPAKNKGPAKLTIATSNDDFTDRFSDVHKIDADVVLVQEAKNTRLRNQRKDETKWGVHQAQRDDKAGVGVLWKKRKAQAIDRGMALGVEPHGAKMLARWISYVDMKVNGQKVRMVSVHRPPKRYDRLWGQFDRNLAKFVKSSKLPIVVGMDANQVNPQRMARATGLKWHAPPNSIDGFLATPGIKFSGMHRLPNRHSDHHPVVADISIPKRLSK